MAKSRPMRKPAWLIWLEYLPVAALLPIVRRIPYRLGLDLCKPLGIILYYLLPRYRRITLANLAIAFGADLSNREAAAIARAAFGHFLQTLYEMVALAHQSPATIARYTLSPIGYAEYQQAVAAGHGVIACSAHLGNWYWTLVCAAAEGYTVNVIVRPLDNPRLDRLMNQLLFERWGIKVIARRRAFPAALAALRRGETLALMIDQNAAIDGCFVSFFGTPAATMRGLPHLMRATGAAVVCTADIREGHHHRALTHWLTNLPVDEQRCLRAINEYFEALIVAHKTCYFWLHPRWKTRPTGEPSLYPGLAV
ncbi:MAG: hypothetical protein U1F68_16995 [Gammaproteobacteria bacterium]